MTYKEKFLEEHPNKTAIIGEGCPYNYSYETMSHCPVTGSNKHSCEACWNRQIPEDNNNEEKEVNKSMTKVEQHLELVTALNKLYEQKNHDYGDSFGKLYRELGIISAVTRISDKYNRLVSLATKPDNERQVLDESISDTLLDMANYCLMAVMELNNEKENKR